VDDVDAIPARYRLLYFVNGSLLLRKFKHPSAPDIGVMRASSLATLTLSKVECLWMPMTFARVSVVNGAMSGGRWIR
jgi:hypothetical protein